MEDFRIEDLDRTISPEAREAITDMILSWAEMDMVISYWLATAANIPLDVGSIIIGNMDTKAKIDRLKTLYRHFGADSTAKIIEGLLKAHAEFVEARNAIAHRKCIGMLKPSYTKLVFASVKRIVKKPGFYETTAIPLEQIVQGTEFARQACRNIWNITAALEERRSKLQGQDYEYSPYSIQFHQN